MFGLAKKHRGSDKVEGMMAGNDMLEIMETRQKTFKSKDKTSILGPKMTKTLCTSLGKILARSRNLAGVRAGS